MRIIGIIQARLGSTRFPRKVLAKLRGRPVLTHVLSRARMIVGLNEVIVATTDAELGSFSRLAPVLVLPSHYELNVLGRVAVAARLTQADMVMRICGDAPLLDVPAAERLIDEYDGESEYVGYRVNGLPHAQVPQGYFPELVSAEALRRTDLLLPMDDFRREHVTQYVYESGGYACQWLCPSPDHATRPPAAIDTPEDLARVEAMQWN